MKWSEYFEKLKYFAKLAKESKWKINALDTKGFHCRPPQRLVLPSLFFRIQRERPDGFDELKYEVKNLEGNCYFEGWFSNVYGGWGGYEHGPSCDVSNEIKKRGTVIWEVVNSNNEKRLYFVPNHNYNYEYFYFAGIFWTADGIWKGKYMKEWISEFIEKIEIEYANRSNFINFLKKINDLIKEVEIENIKGILALIINDVTKIWLQKYDFITLQIFQYILMSYVGYTESVDDISFIF